MYLASMLCSTLATKSVSEIYWDRMAGVIRCVSDPDLGIESTLSGPRSRTPPPSSIPHPAYPAHHMLTTCSPGSVSEPEPSASLVSRSGVHSCIHSGGDSRN